MKIHVLIIIVNAYSDSNETIRIPGIIDSYNPKFPSLKSTKNAYSELYLSRVEKYIFEDTVLSKHIDNRKKYISLEDLFSLPYEIAIQYHIFGTDSFSGAIKHFQSPKYTKDKILDNIYFY